MILYIKVPYIYIHPPFLRFPLPQNTEEVTLMSDIPSNQSGMCRPKNEKHKSKQSEAREKDQMPMQMDQMRNYIPNAEMLNFSETSICENAQNVAPAGTHRKTKLSLS